jgi:hypothetical protein
MARGLSDARTSTRPGRHSRCATQLIASSTNIADNCKNLFTLCRGSEHPLKDGSQSLAAIEPKADFAFGSACAPMPDKAGQTKQDNPDARQERFSPGTAQNTISLPITSDRDQGKAPMIKQAASSGKSQLPAGPTPSVCGSELTPYTLRASSQQALIKLFQFGRSGKKPEQAKPPGAGPAFRPRNPSGASRLKCRVHTVKAMKENGLASPFLKGHQRTGASI